MGFVCFRYTVTQLIVFILFFLPFFSYPAWAFTPDVELTTRAVALNWTQGKVLLTKTLPASIDWQNEPELPLSAEWKEEDVTKSIQVMLPPALFHREGMVDPSLQKCLTNLTGLSYLYKDSLGATSKLEDANLHIDVLLRNLHQETSEAGSVLVGVELEFLLVHTADVPVWYKLVIAPTEEEWGKFKTCYPNKIQWPSEDSPDGDASATRDRSGGTDSQFDRERSKGAPDTDSVLFGLENQDDATVLGGGSGLQATGGGCHLVMDQGISGFGSVLYIGIGLAVLLWRRIKAGANGPEI